MSQLLICLLTLLFSLSSPAMGQNAHFRQSSLAAEGGTSFFEGTSYSTEVMEKMATDPFHNFPESVTAFEDAGQTTTFTGGDGAAYTRLDIPGSYPSQAGTWYNGTFQFIKNSDNVITHRAFIPSP